MKKIILGSTAIFSLLITSCSTTKTSIIPLEKSLVLEETYTIIWNGISKAYIYKNGEWMRAENYDYTFDVIQRRYDNQWKSTKSLHRIHPDYDGRAGTRDQTMYFEVLYYGISNGVVQSNIQSSLGNGTGTSDNDFRKSVLTMYVGKNGKFMPYNKFRITQNYDYEQGILTETVELIKEKDGTETPFMKNEETANIYLKGKLDKAPTSYK